jgi:3',5'-cyclic AMP phosphodiesterase CpdA
MLIAQISDLHVRPKGKLYQGLVASNRMLAQAVEHLEALDPKPDLVLLTGDLVDEGLPAEYAALREILAGLRIPYRLIPGNHDGREALRAAFADHAYLPPQGPLDYAIDAGPLRLVALDTTVPGQHHGAIAEASLAWLDATLGADTDRPVLLMLHHPPFACGIPYLDKYGLEAPDRLAAVVARHPHVERVLCRHVHRPMQARFAGTIAVTCPSTTTQIALRPKPDAPPASFLEPPACLLHLWRPGQGLVTHTSYIGRFEGPLPFA